jgi:hypothetical protein
MENEPKRPPQLTDEEISADLARALRMRRFALRVVALACFIAAAYMIGTLVRP